MDDVPEKRKVKLLIIVISWMDTRAQEAQVRHSLIRLSQREFQRYKHVLKLLMATGNLAILKCDCDLH